MLHTLTSTSSSSAAFCHKIYLQPKHIFAAKTFFLIFRLQSIFAGKQYIFCWQKVFLPVFAGKMYFLPAKTIFAGTVFSMEKNGFFL